MSSEYKEFYVACNPPLLPAAVPAVIQEALDFFDPVSMMEILYEPEIPWFKIITPLAFQSEVSEWLETRLEEILNNDTGLIHSSFEDTGDQTKHEVDVVIFGENPRVKPWTEYKQQQPAVTRDCELHRYPDLIRYRPYKAVWRGLECEDGLTFFQLSDEYGFLGVRKDQPSKTLLERIKDAASCQLTYNMAGNLIYIGSDESSACVEKAKEKLDNLLSLLRTHKTGARNVIFPEMREPLQISYRYLSHVGLAQSTCVSHDHPQKSDELRRVVGAVTLKLSIPDIYGGYILDEATYPLNPRPAYDFKSPFTAFAKYVYPIKAPEVFCEIIEKKAALTGNPTFGSGRTDRLKQSIRGSSTTTRKKSPDQSLGTTSSEPSTRGVARSDAVSCHQIQTKTNIAKPTISKDDGARVHISQAKGAMPSPAISTMLQTPDLKRWIDDVCEAHPQAGIIQHQTPGKADDLVSFDSSDPEALEALGSPLAGFVPPTQVFNAACRPKTPEVSQPNILDQDLLGGDSPVHTYNRLYIPLSPTRQGRVCTPTTVAPADTQAVFGDALISMDLTSENIEVPAMMDQVALFECREDPPSKRHSTMGQQAPPRQTSWAAIAASSPKKGEPSTAGFGANVRVTTQNLERRGGNGYASSQLKTLVARQDTDPPQESPKGSFKQANPNTEPPVLNIKEAQAHEKFFGHDEVLKDAITQIKGLLAVFRVVPGKISLEAKFGRWALKNPPESTVNTGKGSTWPLERMLESLHHPEFCQDNVGFYTVLTTHGGEAEILPHTRLLGGARWELTKTQTSYEFICTSHSNEEELTVVVDAENFEYRCMRQMDEISCLYLHCPRRAFDIKVSLSQCDTAIPTDFQVFADRLVKSLSISYSDRKNVIFEAAQDATFTWAIERVKVRHIATFKNGKYTQSQLNVAMNRVVRLSENSTRDTYRGILDEGKDIAQTSQAQNFEASITSMRAEELLQENEGLSFGDLASWKPDMFEKEGILRAICEPAMTMVTQIDHVGDNNNNGAGPEVGEDIRRNSSDDAFW